MGGGDHRRLIPVFLIGATLLAVGRLCGGDFTWWDDPGTLFRNPLMNPPTWRTLQTYWAHPYMGLYAPLTYTVWSGLAAVARLGAPDERGIMLNPYLFHSFNVLLHAGNVLLVYAILRRLVRLDWAAAAAGALIYGVHPVQVETVGWVSGGKDLMYAACVLGAVWGYVAWAGADTGETPVLRRRGLYWVGMGLMVLGMLCKPTAVMTPLLLAGLDRWALGRDWRAVGRSLWPWCVATVPCLIWTKLSQNVPEMAPVWARPMIALDALAFYLWKLVWPATLVADYERRPVTVMARHWWWVTGVAPLIVGLLLWTGRRRRPTLVAAGWVFVAGVAPVLGFTSFMFQDFSTVADHYLYVPMLGVALAVAWLYARWPRRGTAWAIGAIAAVLTVRSAAQAGAWMNAQALIRHALAVNPDSYVGHTQMATECDVMASADPADAPALLAEAERHERAAVRVRPDRMNPRFGLGMLLVKRGTPAEAVAPLENAVARYQPALDERNDFARAHLVLGAILWRQGRRAEAMGHFEAAARAAPWVEEFKKTLEGARAEMRRSAATMPTTSPVR